MKKVNSYISKLYIGAVCDYHDCGEKCSTFALYCVSGFCAGHIEYVFPLEAKPENSRSICREWIIENWKKKMVVISVK